MAEERTHEPGNESVLRRQTYGLAKEILPCFPPPAANNCPWLLTQRFCQTVREHSRPMKACAINNSIRSKLVLSLAVVFLVFLAINEAVSRSTLSTDAFAVERCSFMLFSASALMALWLLLHRIIVMPLAEFKQQIVSFQGGASSSDAIPAIGNDEIADLSKTFFEMRVRLHDVQCQLAEASEASGRSEVAATVIHNVGNVLTNVNSLVDTASKRVGKLRVSPLHQLAEQLETNANQQELLDATPKYLHGLASQLESDQYELSQLLETLDKNVRHIHGVIRDQHKHAAQRVTLQDLEVGEVIREAIVCCQANLVEDQIHVETIGKPSCMIRVDRSLVLQAMINVITNARMAMKDQRPNDRRLMVVVQADGEIVTVNFVDNGCGMDKETLDRVFDAHFTTRESGSGLGLHFCAIAFKRCGGTIVATSEGTGRGSTLSLKLPVTAFPHTSKSNLPRDQKSLCEAER